VPTVEYISPHGIQVALGLESDGSWFRLSVKPDDVDVPNISPEDKVKCLSSVIICSPAHLFNALQYATDPQCRPIQAFCSLKIVNGGKQIVSLGPCNIDIHSTHNVPKRVLKRAVWDVFNVVLNIDVVVLDYSAAL
jgi:hypothetical protein